MDNILKVYKMIVVNGLGMDRWGESKATTDQDFITYLRKFIIVHSQFNKIMNEMCLYRIEHQYIGCTGRLDLVQKINIVGY